MPGQTASTTPLDQAQAIMIGSMRYTAEYDAPCKGLITSARLPQGNKQITWPKVD
jgi:hypothetical protein